MSSCVNSFCPLAVLTWVGIGGAERCLRHPGELDGHHEASGHGGVAEHAQRHGRTLGRLGHDPVTAERDRDLDGLDGLVVVEHDAAPLAHHGDAVVSVQASPAAVEALGLDVWTHGAAEPSVVARVTLQQRALLDVSGLDYLVLDPDLGPRVAAERARLLAVPPVQGGLDPGFYDDYRSFERAPGWERPRAASSAPLSNHRQTVFLLMTIVVSFRVCRCGLGGLVRVACARRGPWTRNLARMPTGASRARRARRWTC